MRIGKQQLRLRIPPREAPGENSETTARSPPMEVLDENLETMS